MSLFARRLLLNRNVLRCSLTPIKQISTCNESILNKVAPVQKVHFKIFKANYATDNSNELRSRFDKLVKKDKIVVFMKGTPEKPMCGFSKAVCDILKFHGASFEAHNVLADETIRSGVKEYTDWPTIPQIFFNGEFIGGCDILLEMHKTGDIVEELKKIGIESKAEKKE